MGRISIVLVLAIVAFSLFGAAGNAGQQPAKPSQPQPAQQDNPRIGVLEVRLPISVKEKGKGVAGLTEPNFEVYEDGKRQKIFNFMSPSNLPLNVAVLMDTSNSVKLKLPFEKDAAEDFVATVTTYRKKDKVLFITFDSSVELRQDFTDAQEPLVRAIRAVKAGGYTRMYDAVYRVIEEKMSGNDRTDARRVIVILTDGEDTASEHTLKEAIELAQRYDVTIFGVSTKNFTGSGSGMVENADDKELRRLCEDTGGQVFLPSQKMALFQSFSQVANDLRAEYVVFYRPDNQNHTGKKRDIKVKLVGAGGHPYYKQGYTY